MTGFGSCNKEFVQGVVPKEWKRAVYYRLYNGKSQKGNYGGISLLNIECCYFGWKGAPSEGVSLVDEQG